MAALEDGGATWRKPLSFAVEPQMLLRETFRKTKVFFHKSFQNFRSFFFGEYQKLPRSLSFNPFLCRVGNAKTHTSDQFYNEFYDMLQSDLGRIKMHGNNNNNNMSMSGMEDAATCSGSGRFMCFAEESIHNKERAQEKKNKGSSENMNKKKKTQVLAQKMKAMDMMDAGDVEHVLDIEEALHYYSRLKSPLYLDIVDNFFKDLSVVPQKPSKERLGPIRLR